MGMADYEKKQYYATARVNCVIEVQVHGSWGGEASVAQVHKQAADDARGRVAGLASEGIRIVGEPEVTAVMARSKS